MRSRPLDQLSKWKVLSAMGQREVFGHLAAAQRAFRPLQAGLDAGEVGLGGGQRLLALGDRPSASSGLRHTTMRSWVMRPRSARPA